MDYLIVGLLVLNFYFIYKIFDHSKRMFQLQTFSSIDQYTLIKMLGFKMDKNDLKMRILENYCQRSLDNEDKIQELKIYNDEIKKLNKNIKREEEWLKKYKDKCEDNLKRNMSILKGE